MSFSNFFREYKIEVCSLKSAIAMKDWPRFMKAGFIIFIVSFVLAIVLIVCKKYIGGAFLYLLAISATVVIGKMMNRKDILKKNTEAYFKPYARIKMDKLISLLQEYNIKPNDTEKIKLLIEQSEEAKRSSNIFDDFTKAGGKWLVYIFLSVGGFVASKVADNLSMNDLITCTIIFLIFVSSLIFIVYVGLPTFADILQLDKKKYNELKLDLQQILIFYDNGYLIKK